MSLIHNEQTKLTVNALDRASTACITVGVLGPVVAALYGVGSHVTAGWIALGAALWLIAAGVLTAVQCPAPARLGTAPAAVWGPRNVRLLFHPHIEKGGAILTKVKSDGPAVASQAWPAYHSPVATDDGEVSFFPPAPVADKGR
jgi:hypothetical protein